MAPLEQGLGPSPLTCCLLLAGCPRPSAPALWVQHPTCSPLSTQGLRAGPVPLSSGEMGVCGLTQDSHQPGPSLPVSFPSAARPPGALSCPGEGLQQTIRPSRNLWVGGSGRGAQKGTAEGAEPTDHSGRRGRHSPQGTWLLGCVSMAEADGWGKHQDSC